MASSAAPQNTGNESSDFFTLYEVAAALDVHYMTVYKYVRSGRLPAHRDGTHWQIHALDLEKFISERSTSKSRSTHDQPTTPKSSADQKAKAQKNLVDRLLANDLAGAWSIVENSLTSSMTPDQIHDELLRPAMRIIGDRWSRGDLSVADEHIASGCALRIVAALGFRFSQRGPRRGTVILAAPTGESHALPIAMVSDQLRWLGFSVIELGPNTPAESIVETVLSADSLLAVGIVCTHTGSLAMARSTIAAIHEVSDVSVIVGGAAVKSEKQAMELGADRYTDDKPGSVRKQIELIYQTSYGANLRKK